MGHICEHDLKINQMVTHPLAGKANLPSEKNFGKPQMLFIMLITLP